MTDIEGSTRLWEEQRAAMDVALGAHDALLRAAVEGAGGTVFKTTGDGLLATFERPEAAVEAALAGQRALGAQAWPTTEPLRVRMAIHAGAAQARDGDFFGPTLNRTARLLAIGHGGQILVSAAAAALIADDLPVGSTLLDRGEHRLRDLSRPEHVFQLTAAGLASDFPPLRSGAAPTNLPAELTSFIGRERQTAEIQALLGRHRLVSLVGVGGTGKTRLLLHVAAKVAGQHPDGAWLVELARLREPDLVIPEVARTLGIPNAPGRRVIDGVIEFLRDKDLLLLLDNCEHLIGAAAELVEQLLGSCRSLQVLATSREGLGIPGEATYAVPSLALPEALDHLDLEAVAASEAVRLFSERAMSIQPAFRLDEATAGPLVEICRRLDGIPLALELAAARINVLSVDEIAAGLGDRFRLLTGGRRTAVPRQQTLQAMIDWSWDLLDDDDQRLLRRLAVFAGGWTLESAAAVAGEQDDPGEPPTGASRHEVLDGLGRLVDRSLVVVAHARATRYGMLETIRQYASDRLVAGGEADMIRARHLARFRRSAVDARAGLEGADMVAWLERLDGELDNLRAALDWAFEVDERAALEMCEALVGYWRSRSMAAEGWARMKHAVEVARRWRLGPSGASDPERTVLAARVMAGALWVSTSGGWSSFTFGDEALAVAHEAGDDAAILDALWMNASSRIMLADAGDTGWWRAAAEESAALAARLDDPFRLTMAQTMGAMTSTDPTAAEGWLERAAESAHRSGNPWAIANVTQIRGRAAGRMGHEADAQRWFHTAQEQFHAIGDTQFEITAQSELAHSLRRAGKINEAEVEYRQAIRGWRHSGNRGAVANQLECLAFIAVASGDGVRAARLLGAAEALREAAGDSMTAFEQVEYDAEMARLRGRLDAESLGDAWAEGRAMSMQDAVAFAVSL